MKNVNLKKLLILNIPYVFIALFATKLGQAARLAPGFDFSSKFLHIMEGFTLAFTSAMPSFHLTDLLVGICCAAGLRLAVYIKGKNARKAAAEAAAEAAELAEEALEDNVYSWKNQK